MTARTPHYPPSLRSSTRLGTPSHSIPQLASPPSLTEFTSFSTTETILVAHSVARAKSPRPVWVWALVSLLPLLLKRSSKDMTLMATGTLELIHSQDCKSFTRLSAWVRSNLKREEISFLRVLRKLHFFISLSRSTESSVMNTSIWREQITRGSFLMFFSTWKMSMSW